jgi:hypothetical protein
MEKENKKNILALNHSRQTEFDGSQNQTLVAFQCYISYTPLPIIF